MKTSFLIKDDLIKQGKNIDEVNPRDYTISSILDSEKTNVVLYPELFADYLIELNYIDPEEITNLKMKEMIDIINIDMLDSFNINREKIIEQTVIELINDTFDK